MKFILKWFRRLWYLVWYLFAVGVVFMAAVFGLVRLLLPLVDDYNQDIENYASKLIDRPIKVMSLDAEWHGFSPSLVLNNVRLLSKDGSQTLLQLARARLDFDLIGMAATGTVQFKRFALSGANLSIVRRDSGELILSGFESNRLEATVANERRRILRWLLDQGEINLHAKNLIYHDRKGGDSSYHFSNISLVLRNEADQHFIDGTVRFPEKTDQELVFSLDVVGDVTAGNRWAANMYFSGANIDIAKMFGDFNVNGHQLSVGSSNFEIWSEWRDASLTGLQGDFSLGQVGVVSEANFTPLLQPLLTDARNETVTAEFNTQQSFSVSYDKIIGRFKWNRYQDGWQLKADRFVLSRNRRVWPATQLDLRYFKTTATNPQVDFRASLVRIEDLTPLLPMLVGHYQNYTSLSRQLSLRGDIENIHAKWSARNNQYSLAGRVVNVKFNPVGKVPGFSGLQGVVRLDNKQGNIALDVDNGEFTYPQMFRWDIPVAKLQGNVNWQQDESSITVSTRNLALNTAHARSIAVLDLKVPLTTGSPFISLIMKIVGGDGSKASYYYPVSIMKDKTVKWLDSAIVQGDVTSGGAIVYGPLDQFPFTEGQGVFDVRFNTENAILDYADGWPQIHDARASVVFRGNKLSVTSNHARIFNSMLSNVNVAIENLKSKPLKLAISGRVSGKSQEKLNYLMVSPPLNEIYGKYLRDLKATGASDLDLDIQLKVAEKVDSTVSGKLYLKENGLVMRSIPDMLSDVTGTLQISDKGIGAKKINAKILGQPAQLAVQTLQRSGLPERRDIIVKASGKFDARELSEQRFPVMKDLVDGSSRWQIMLSVPSGGDTKTRRNVQLAISTKLRGVAVNLPPPFTKQKDDSRTMEVFIDIRDAGRMLLKVSYADRFAGVFEGDISAPFWVVRGDVRVGGGPVVLPGTRGLRIGGRIRELSVDIWKTLIEQTMDQYDNQDNAAVVGDRSSKTLPAHMRLVNYVDLYIDNFEVFGQQVKNLNLKIDNKDQWLAAELESKQMQGTIIVPADLDKNPLEFDMQQVQLTSAEAGGSKPDPRTLPGIVFNSRSFTYDNKKLGAVAFEAAKTTNGLLLQQLIIRPRATTVKGHGYWLVERGQQESMFEFMLNSDDLGKTMRDLGYVDTIAGGKGKFSAKLQWPGSIIDPDWYHINGDVELDFEDGRILDIEPGGAARLFGLFSLQTLPRRLTLDFSDLFGKGLGFDSVHGQFNVESGDAYTNNFVMKGPSADVSLSGRIGLGTQDYDQRLRVTPHITDSTILLSIITSQPLLFFFQQLLKEDVDKAASFEYSLTGPWDNYMLEPVLKEAPLAPETDGF